MPFCAIVRWCGWGFCGVGTKKDRFYSVLDSSVLGLFLLPLGLPPLRWHSAPPAAPFAAAVAFFSGDVLPLRRMDCIWLQSVRSSDSVSSLLQHGHRIPDMAGFVLDGGRMVGMVGSPCVMDGKDGRLRSPGPGGVMLRLFQNPCKSLFRNNLLDYWNGRS